MQEFSSIRIGPNTSTPKLLGDRPGKRRKDIFPKRRVEKAASRAYTARAMRAGPPPLRPATNETRTRGRGHRARTPEDSSPAAIDAGRIEEHLAGHPVIFLGLLSKRSSSPISRRCLHFRCRGRCQCAFGAKNWSRLGTRLYISLNPARGSRRPARRSRRPDRLSQCCCFRRASRRSRSPARHPARFITPLNPSRRPFSPFRPLPKSCSPPYSM